MHRRNRQKNQDDNVGFDEIVRSKESYNNFVTELRAMVVQLKKFCSVVVWVLFNEGWGQSKTLETVQLTRFWDPTRLIDAVSGWNDPLLFGEPYPIIQFEEYPDTQEKTKFSY